MDNVKIILVSQYLGRNPKLAASLLHDYSKDAYDWLKRAGYEVELEESVLPFKKIRDRGWWFNLFLLWATTVPDGDYSGNPLTGSIGYGYIDNFIQELKIPDKQTVIFITDIPVYNSGSFTSWGRIYENKVWVSISDCEFMREKEEFIGTLENLMSRF